MKRQREKPNGQKISEILTALPEQFPSERITVKELKEALSGRSYGIFLLILALPNLVPIPAPGLSAVLGVPLLLFTFQLMLGYKAPWFPGFIARRHLRCKDIENVCKRVMPYLKKLEIVIKPRLTLLAKPPADRIIALICVLLSLIIMLPIPFGNALPALAICLFALGILERDGLLVTFGLVVAAISIIVITAFTSGILASVKNVLGS